MRLIGLSAPVELHFSWLLQEVIMRVAEVMTRHVVSVPVDATLVEAAELMKNYDIGFLPVVAGDILV
jgi:CBS domain-containing protein